MVSYKEKDFMKQLEEKSYLIWGQGGAYYKHKTEGGKNPKQSMIGCFILKSNMKKKSNVTTKCNMLWNRKKSQVKKLRKSKENMDFS